MPYYLNMPDCEGNVTAHGYEGWIVLRGMRFGSATGVAQAAGYASDGRRAHAARVSEMTLLKELEDSSGQLFTRHLNRVGGGVAKIHCVSTGVSTPTKLLEIELKDPLITSWSMETSGGTPIETLTVSFTAITTTHYVRGQDDTKSKPGYTSSYDLSAGSTS